MRFVDARAREPATQLSPGATGEWKTRGELHLTGRLADDHHAIAGLARDDRERAIEISRGDAARARADVRVHS